MEEEEFLDEKDQIEENNEIKPNSITDLIIQLNHSYIEQSIPHILVSFNLLLEYSKKYPIPLTQAIHSYDFIPILTKLYFFPNFDVSLIVAKLILMISYHSHSEVVECLINNHFFEQILLNLLSFQNEEFLKINLMLIINFISDFPDEVEDICLNQESMNNFYQIVSSRSVSNIITEKIIIILSIISGFEIEFKKKLSILDLSIQFLEDESFKQFWPLFLSIPTKMIINNDACRNVLSYKNSKILQICQEFIRSDDELLNTSAICCIGQYFVYSNQYICVDFRKIMKCAGSISNVDLSYYSLCLLNNALAINSDVILMIEMSGDIYQLLYSVFESDSKLKCKIEAVRGMQSIIKQGTKDQIVKAIHSNFIVAFIQAIEIDLEEEGNGMKFAEKILSTLDFLLNVKIVQMKDSKLADLCWNQFYESCGLDTIEELAQNGKNIASMAQRFIQKMKNNNVYNKQAFNLYIYIVFHIFSKYVLR